MIPSKKMWDKALSERYGNSIKDRISSSVVAVCGIGGLGSNIAFALTRAGVGKLILADYDKVDITNIHRQQYKTNQIGLYKTEALRDNLREINPYSDIVIHNLRLSDDNYAGVLAEADVICEAFDNPAEKASLVNYILETMPDKFVVAASGMAGLESCNTIKTRRISKNFYLCGDEISDASCKTGLISTRVMLCAAHQAHTVLRIITGKYEV